MEEDIIAFLASESNNTSNRKKKKKKRKKKIKKNVEEKIEKKKDKVALEKTERRIDDVELERFASESCILLKRCIQEWKAKRVKGTEIITSIINIRSEISHVNSMESSSVERDCVDATNESEAVLWYRLQKLHRKLEIVHKSLENLYQEILDLHCRAESLMRLPGLDIHVMSGHSKSDHVGLAFYTSLIVEIEIMFSQSIFLKHMVYKQILSRNADYKQLVVLVSLWDTEPNFDTQRFDDILDLFDLSSRKG